MASLTFIDFFAGIGGISLGLERAGHKCVGMVEIDEFCLKVLDRHWPDVPKWRDITKVEAHDLPQADLWTAGFPCQDISNAGKRAGIRGERSGLFFGLVRLVRPVRTRYLLLENTPGLLSRGMDSVLGALAEIGFDAEWESIPASALGAPHIRDRVFIFAERGGDATLSRFRRLLADARCMGEFNPDESTLPRPDTASPRTGRADVAHAGGDGLEGPVHAGDCAATATGVKAGRATARRSGAPRRHHWPAEPAVGRVAHGVPNRVDRLKALGNAVVPQVAEYIGRLLYEATEGNGKTQIPDNQSS